MTGIAWVIRLRKRIWPAIRDEVAQKRELGSHNSGPLLATETVLFYLYRKGLLMTPTAEEIVRALEAFWSDLEPDPDDPEEMRLYNALQRYKEERVNAKDE